MRMKIHDFFSRFDSLKTYGNLDIKLDEKCLLHDKTEYKVRYICDTK